MMTWFSETAQLVSDGDRRKRDQPVGWTEAARQHGQICLQQRKPLSGKIEIFLFNSFRIFIFKHYQRRAMHRVYDWECASRVLVTKRM
jgi:hypothetical protein